MSGKFFLDTNILVYAKDKDYPEKQQKADALVKQAFDTGIGVVSPQVLNEFYVTVTRKLSPGLARNDARKAVEALFALCPEYPTRETLELAWSFEDRYSLSFWDALITASAYLQNCEVVYSEDMQNGLNIEKMTIVNPFAARDMDIADLG